jgi:hypothetical protein
MPQFPITAVLPRVQYTAANLQTVFAYPWPIFTDEDIKVWRTPIGSEPSEIADLLTLNIDYTVTGAGTENGGTIVLNLPAVGGDILTLQREMAIERLTNYSNGNAINADALNADFDRLTMMLQDLNVFIQEIIPKYEIPTVIAEEMLKLPELLQGYIWQGGPNNTVIAVTNDCEDAGCSTLRSELANESPNDGSGAFIVGYYDQRTGSTTVGDELNHITQVIDGNFLSILDFGATNNGSTDTTPALTAAYDYCADNDIHTIIFPAGVYSFNTQPEKTPIALSIIGAGQAITQLFRNFNATGSDGLFEAENHGLLVSGFTAVAGDNTTGGSFFKVTATNAVLYNHQVSLKNCATSFEGTGEFDYGAYIAGLNDFTINGPSIDKFYSIGANVRGIYLASIIEAFINASLDEGFRNGDIQITGTAIAPSYDLNINLAIVTNIVLDRVQSSVITATIRGGVTNTANTEAIAIYGGFESNSPVKQENWISSRYITRNDFDGEPIVDGYQILPNGLIMQFMRVTVNVGPAQNFTLPIPFKSVNFGLFGNTFADVGGDGQLINDIALNTLSSVNLLHAGVVTGEYNILVIGK